jgi:cytochrome c biogenesis protein
MKLFKFQQTFSFFAKFKFGISILAIIALFSSLGSFIEQDENIEFYKENYAIDKPIYGFITWKSITFLGLDHIYTTWWFLSLLIILGISLVSCTFTRQFPLLSISKEYFFRKKKTSFLPLPFSIKLQTIYFLKEYILLQIQNLNFYVYQTKNFLYGYKGLIGRISPILVHVSLILILLGSGLGALKNFKAQEILPKGELFHIQNTIGVGWFTSLPSFNIRVNDFWVEYEKNKIHQFYSNLSILDNYGNEIKEQTISVNNPLRYKNVDFYQSDWNLLGIRVQDLKNNQIYEIPLFSLKNNSKSWITWLEIANKNYSLIFNQLQNTFFVFDQSGNFLSFHSVGDSFNDNLVLEILPSTGLLIKYDPSIQIIYFGFALLMITTCLSYFPYNQIWIFSQVRTLWFGSLTNRGKIQLEIDFENLMRFGEKQLNKSIFRKR